jgi:SnoaL-like protein
MSAERNLETVRRWFGAAPIRDPAEMERLVEELWDLESDYYPLKRFTEIEPCHGREEIARFHRRFVDDWEEWNIDLLEIEPVGDDRVLVRTAIQGTGRVSGVTLEGELYHCFWLRRGRILRLEDHQTESGARRGFGLDEEDSPQGAA